VLFVHGAWVRSARAEKFDFTPFRTPSAVIEGLAPLLGEPRSIDAALDVCCGTGAAIGFLRPLCRKRVVGIDFSCGMLDEARRHYPDRPGQATVELVQGNALEMEFNQEFDLAVTLGSLGHVRPREEPRFVERIHAALVSGGRFVFVTTEMPPWWSRSYLLSRSFNAAMHVRNALWRPPFVMFYLTFLWPGIAALLERQGFQVELHPDVYSGPWKPLKVVVATKA
jgi:ubiquinone/menaquinone biosynthesis C-methylase UbiE